MARQRIVSLRFASTPDWAMALGELAARVELAPVDDVQLACIDDERGVLVVLAADDAAFARFDEAVLEPWLAACSLAIDGAQIDGELVWRSEAPEADLRDDDARVRGFVDAALTSGSVWSLRGKTWARSAVAGDTEALPLWPDEASATRCAVGAWAGFGARPIELEAFVDEWLGGMHEDGIVAVVQPTPSHPGVIVDPRALAAALRRAE